MSDFKTKMHQIQIRLGLRLRPRQGSIQRSPDPLARFRILLRERGKEKGWKERGSGGREGEGDG